MKLKFLILDDDETTELGRCDTIAEAEALMDLIDNQQAAALEG